MNLNEKLKKLSNLQSISSTCLEEIQNSPIKILKSYIEEQKLQKFPSESQTSIPITMLNKKPFRQKSLKSMIISRKSPFKSIQDYSLQTSVLKTAHSFDTKTSSKSISNLPSLSTHSAVETLTRDISLKKKELGRNYSSDKVTAKLSLYYRKLTRIRNQYQQALIKKCRRLPKLSNLKDCNFE
jgi:hypothetical protein